MLDIIIQHKTKILPSLLILINLVAASIYFYDNDWRKGIYWISAAVLTSCVTF